MIAIEPQPSRPRHPAIYVFDVKSGCRAFPYALSIEDSPAQNRSIGIFVIRPMTIPKGRDGRGWAREL
jgi:hypothetical protein